MVLTLPRNVSADLCGYRLDRLFFCQCRQKQHRCVVGAVPALTGEVAASLAKEDAIYAKGGREGFPLAPSANSQA